MSLLDNLGNAFGNAYPTQISVGQRAGNPAAALEQLKANPAQVLRDRGINIPAGMTNPQQIVQHLVQSGQVPQSRLTQAMQMAQRFAR